MALRFLANENIPGETVKALQLEGHDVIWVRSHSPGSTDGAVLAQAQEENRILITFDKDFGELAFRQRLPASSVIILLRLEMASPNQVTSRILTALKTRSDWAGHFSVVEANRIRMTPFQQ